MSMVLAHTLLLSHLHNVETERTRRREDRCLATTYAVSTDSVHCCVVFGLDSLTITFFYDLSFETASLSLSLPLLQIESFFVSLIHGILLQKSTEILSGMNNQPTDYSSIDAFHVGRRRKPNFTDHEVINIIDQYDRYKELLHSREASKSVIAQKQAIWRQITDTLNATYPQVERTVEDVRRKWKKLQSEAKREVAAYRAAHAAGSTVSPSNRQMSLYNRILSMCRAPTPSSTAHLVQHAATAAVTRYHQQSLQQQLNVNNRNHNNHEISFNERVRN